MRIAGIMSGTSLDGIDVAIVDIEGRGWEKRVSPVETATTPYPSNVRSAILAVSNRETHTREIARLHFLLGELYAEAVVRLCQRAQVPLASVELIGCHGQTIFHEGAPVSYLGRRVASTLQIGEPSVIAERTGIPVAADFRPRDIAAGGCGAPLVPYVDYLLFRHRRRGRIALNIGGIANITAIPAGGAPESVVAFDTGPGNMVIDALAAQFTGGRLKYDRGGRLAAKGHVREDLLEQLLADPYYREKPPKTAGREQYGKEFVAQLLAGNRPALQKVSYGAAARGPRVPGNRAQQSAAGGMSAEDLIATATALTAATVAEGIRRFAPASAQAGDLIVSGGGAHNPRIIAYLAAFLPAMMVTTSSAFGVDVDAKEAIAFAILAYETWHGRPSNLPSATGARRAAVLGKIVYAGAGPRFRAGQHASAKAARNPTADSAPPRRTVQGR